jgi:hypothetical protein
MRGLEPDAGDCCRATSLSAPFMLVDRWGAGGALPLPSAVSFCFSLCWTCCDLSCILWVLSVLYAYAVWLYI